MLTLLTECEVWKCGWEDNNIAVIPDKASSSYLFRTIFKIDLLKRKPYEIA
jgi:hypothetical protein